MSTEPDELYRALLTSARLPQMRRLTYRCATPARCLLLDAVDTPLGVLLHQRRYKQSRGINEARSSAQGRAKNTSDGDNHWLPRTYWLEQSALSILTEPDVIGGETGHLAVQCDHVGVRPDGGSLQLSGDEFDADWSVGHAVVLMRPDGSRLV